MCEKGDRQYLIDHFCDFVRESCSDADGSDGHRLWTRAVSILSARLQPRARVSWRGAQFDLAGLVLRDTELNRVDLTGTTLLLDGAHVTGTVRFERSVFGPDCVVSLRGANLDGGRLLFSAADFQAGQVDLRECRLEGGAVDEAGGSEPTSNVQISSATLTRPIYRQFGHPDGNESVCAILQSVRDATASPAAPESEPTGHHA